MNKGKRSSVSRHTISKSHEISETIKKSAVMREKIMEAARRVFAEHEYNAASIRMVATEGNFGYGIIRYYFPNKAELFKAVLKEICTDLFDMNNIWLNNVKDLPLTAGLTHYVEHLLTYNAEKPEVLRIFVQNMALMENPDSMPGHELITKFLVDTRRAMEEKLPLRSDTETTRRFIDSFNGLVLYYLGASPFEASILDVDPKSSAYREWVKETLISVFLPLLKHIIAG
jgi:AcrR family transcriptional regulator